VSEDVALFPYLQLICANGVTEALKESSDLRRGVCTFNGYLTTKPRRTRKFPHAKLEALLKKE